MAVILSTVNIALFGASDSVSKESKLWLSPDKRFTSIAMADHERKRENRLNSGVSGRKMSLYYNKLDCRSRLLPMFIARVSRTCWPLWSGGSDVTKWACTLLSVRDDDWRMCCIICIEPAICPITECTELTGTDMQNTRAACMNI